MYFSIFGYLSEVEFTFDPPAIEFHVTVFFQDIKPFIGLTCYCTLLSLCTSLDSFHLSLPVSDSHYLSVRRSVYVQYLCVTFLPLSAAESAAGAEPEVRCWVTDAPDVTLSDLLPCQPLQNAQRPASPPCLHHVHIHWSWTVQPVRLLLSLASFWCYFCEADFVINADKQALTAL